MTHLFPVKTDHRHVEIARKKQPSVPRETSKKISESKLDTQSFAPEQSANSQHREYPSHGEKKSIPIVAKVNTGSKLKKHLQAQVTPVADILFGRSKPPVTRGGDVSELLWEAIDSMLFVLTLLP